MFIKILDELIEQHGTTRAQLSKELKFANGSIHNWETRKTIPSGDILIKLADYFGVSVDYLLGRTAESPPCALSPKAPENGDNNIIGDPDLSELIRIYNSLSERGKGKLLGYAAAISEPAPEKKAATSDNRQSVSALSSVSN